jgi:hypothetical protein
MTFMKCMPFYIDSPACSSSNQTFYAQAAQWHHSSPLNADVTPQLNYDVPAAAGAANRAE